MTYAQNAAELQMRYLAFLVRVIVAGAILTGLGAGIYVHGAVAWLLLLVLPLALVGPWTSSAKRFTISQYVDWLRAKGFGPHEALMRAYFTQSYGIVIVGGSIAVFYWIAAMSQSLALNGDAAKRIGLGVLVLMIFITIVVLVGTRLISKGSGSGRNVSDALDKPNQR